MHTAPPPRLRDTFIAGIVIVVITYILSFFFTGCARVPLATHAPVDGGRVAKLTTIGGSVTVTTPEGYTIKTDHTDSFQAFATTVDKAGSKLIGWKIFDRGIDRLDTRDTIEAAAAKQQDAADLARLAETNDHTRQVLESTQAHELAKSALP